MKTALRLAALAALAIIPALPHGSTAVASDITCDPPARWADRYDTGDARLAITTEDGDVTLLLTRRVVAFQLSDRTFHKVDRKLHREREDEEDNPLADAIKAAVVGSVRALLDHSLECRIRDLRSVDYRKGRLVFVTEDGDRLFADMEINDSDVVESFSPEDARAFVREFRRLKAQEG